MVKGFRYKLYSTVSDSDQLQKEEKVTSIVTRRTTIFSRKENLLFDMHDTRFATDHAY